MKKTTIALLIAILTFSSITTAAAEDLGSILRDNKLDKLVGTWVDADTKGKKLKTHYEWKYKDKVLESTSWDLENDKVSTSLMGFNPKTKEVFHVGVDSHGGSSIGKHTLSKDGAVLELAFMSAEGIDGGLKMEYKLIDKKTMIITLFVPEPIVFKLIKVK